MPLHLYTSTFLVLLLCLHVNWFYLIVRMAFRLLAAGNKNVKDVRSDSEEDDDEEDNNNVKTNKGNKRESNPPHKKKSS